ncbi:hypothetical protein H2200_000086 [Cladophialophora chaetospira]|uniref:Major facilitator superfamily (MFS) profile domain-containing protein n=1 Tax=Cladophialophora chaetospira TaxID=386627 RepID=A0AA38XMS2_9EURO|nr:hypothetical protein H2200_000086 [Cladophialophora chaetospira]
MPAISAFFNWLYRETGLQSVREYGNRDIYLILVTRFLRMFAYGGAALVLAIFLYTQAGVNWKQIGTFMTLTLLGDAAISYGLTIVADKIGRRRVLLVGSALMTLAGTVFAFSKNYYVLLFAAIFGVISPGAHEVGPFRAVEEGILAQLAPLEARTDIFAWFAVSSTLAMAWGLFVTGWITYAQKTYLKIDWKETYPAVFGMYAIIGIAKFLVTLLLSKNIEAKAAGQYSWAATTTSMAEVDEETANPASEQTRPLLNGDQRRSSTTKQTNIARTTSIRSGSSSSQTQPRPANNDSVFRRIRTSLSSPWKVSRSSLPILLRLSLLFGLNAFASGMLPLTVMSWYMKWRSRWFLEHRIGYALSLVWLAASISNLFSAAVARRLGLVKAMVCTHLPSAVFLALVPLGLVVSGWKLLLFFLLGDAVFGSMDQAPREAFVAAVFLPRERTQVLGTLNFVRTLGACMGPIVTGMIWTKERWWVPFELAAGLKICYDIGLLIMFLHTPLPEERRRVGLDIQGEPGGQAMGITAAEMDVNVLMDQLQSGESGLANPSDFDVSDDEDDDGDLGQYKPLVLIGYVGTALIVVSIIAFYYLTAYDPSKDPFRKNDSADASNGTSYHANPLDTCFLGLLRKSKQSIQSSKERTTSPPARSLQSRLEAACIKCVLSMSDLQIWAGISILASGFAQLKCGLSCYHWQLLTYVAWFSAVTHLACLTILRNYLYNRQGERLWRICGMLVVLVMLIVALIPTGNYDFQQFDGDSRPYPGEYAMCYFWQMSRDLDVVVPTVLSILILALGFASRVVRLHKTISVGIVTWLIYAFIWGCLRVVDAYHAIPQDRNTDWGFGQIVPVVLLAGPLLTVVEYFVPEESTSKPDILNADPPDPPSNQSRQSTMHVAESAQLTPPDRVRDDPDCDFYQHSAWYSCLIYFVCADIVLSCTVVLVLSRLEGSAGAQLYYILLPAYIWGVGPLGIFNWFLLLQLLCTVLFVLNGFMVETVEVGRGPGFSYDWRKRLGTILMGCNFLGLLALPVLYAVPSITIRNVYGILIWSYLGLYVVGGAFYRIFG